MPAGTGLVPITTLQESEHVITVFLQDFSIVTFRPRSLAKPPYKIDGALHPNPSNIYPFCRGRQRPGVVPVEILRHVEPKVIAKTNEEMILVEVPRRHTLIPNTTDIYNETTIRFEESLEFIGKGKEPRYILIYFHRTIGFLLLEGQRKWRGGHDEIDGFIRQPSHHREGIPKIRLS